MKILYSNKEVESQCTSVKEANKLFGGNKKYVLGLMSRINAIENAENLKDIICIPTFRFHKLQGDLEGYFAIDVTNKRDRWRIILCPLDENEERIIPCNIGEFLSNIQIVEIEEVSSHYE